MRTPCLVALVLSLAAAPGIASPPDGFVDVPEMIPDARYDIRYLGSENFIGRPVTGYERATCILSEPAAKALTRVQREAMLNGLTLKIFDCFRPQRAVDDFVRWGRDLADLKMKAAYYPRVPKDELFERGYIAEKSGHSRGSTVDLTLVVTDPARATQVLQGPITVGAEVDMGSPFDLFDPRSHTENPDMSAHVRHNRAWFAALMDRHGFSNLPEEWWHYTLRDEPYPDRFFDFPVE
ncbi:MAG: M15 family metallopeptidase [Azoarcus sp.]|nr:M15 family metallopeptidase [Azoarcus sp.]